MRVMVIVKGDEQAAKAMPQSEKEELFAAMGNYNAELVRAGVLLAGEGLQPSARGKRVVFAGGTMRVVDGPFSETHEIVGGFWLWQVKNLDEALEWARRCPVNKQQVSTLELRPVYETEDFGPELTPELREQEERLRAEVAAHQEAPTRGRTP